MQFRQFKAGIIAVAVVMTSMLLLSCNEPKLYSKWRDRDIHIDGVDPEWQDCRLYLDEETGTSVGIYNDNKYIYLSFATQDKMLQRKIIAQGLFTWFNPKGNKDKKTGIFFPTGLIGKYVPNHTPWGDRKRKSRPATKNKTAEEASSYQEAGFEMPSPDIEIHIPEKAYEKNILLDEIAAYGFEAQFKQHGGRLVYELKLPLTDNKMMPDIIVGARSGQIGIGFITRKVDKKSIPTRFGGGRRGPGRRISSGADASESTIDDEEKVMGRSKGDMGRSDGRNARYKEPDRKSIKKLLKVYELWTKVELAAQP